MGAPSFWTILMSADPRKAALEVLGAGLLFPLVSKGETLGPATQLVRSEDPSSSNGTWAGMVPQRVYQGMAAS